MSWPCPSCKRENAEEYNYCTLCKHVPPWRCVCGHDNTGDDSSAVRCDGCGDGRPQWYAAMCRVTWDVQAVRTLTLQDKQAKRKQMIEVPNEEVTAVMLMSHAQRRCWGTDFIAGRE